MLLKRWFRGGLVFKANRLLYHSSLQVVSVGLDGRLCMWDLSLDAALAALTI